MPRIVSKSANPETAKLSLPSKLNDDPNEKASKNLDSGRDDGQFMFQDSVCRKPMKDKMPPKIVEKKPIGDHYVKILNKSSSSNSDEKRNQYVVLFPAKNDKIADVEKTEKSPDDPESRKKHRKLFVILGIIIFLVVLSAAGVVIGYYLIVDEETLSLTEICLSKFGKDKCYFHLDPYPFNCTTTFCSQIFVQISTPNVPAAKVFVYNVSLDSKSMNVPDGTPCASGKTCQKGICVQAEGPKLTHDAVCKNAYTWQIFDHLHASSSKCFSFEKFNASIVGEIAQCFDNSCNFTNGSEVSSSNKFYRFGFRICSGFPVKKGVWCWKSNIASYHPHNSPVVAVECSYCKNELFGKSLSTTHTCSYMDGNNRTTNRPLGYPCRTDNLLGVCYQNICIPYYNKGICCKPDSECDKYD